MKRSGFTLTEMLIVLAVIAALAGIGIPLGRSVVAKSREASCLNQLRSLGVALEGYLQEHNRVLPGLAMGRSSRSDESSVLEAELLAYAETPAAFKCPQDSKEFEKSGSSYFWNHLQSGLPVSQVAFFGVKDRPDKIPLILDKEAWHPNGTNFLYADQSASNKVRFTATN
jgi:prepilin-type N-terminal cleavage/methylation domain-containing protein/prepilin-type processing-associated H-X9-DG protein